MDKLTETCVTVLDKLQLGKRSKSSYITAAIFLIVFQQVYSFFRVPKTLRGYPVISCISMAKSYLSKESPIDRLKRIVLPSINENGFYVSKVPVGWRLYITDPIVAKQLLVKTDNFPKDESFADMVGENTPIMQFFGRNNIAMANGHTWKRQRKVMNPSFHRPTPLKTMETVAFTLFSVIDAEGDKVPVTKRMKEFALDVLGKALFDFDFMALQGDPEGWTATYNTVIETIMDPITNVFPTLDFLLTSIYPKRMKGAVAVAKLNAKFDKLAEDKRIDIKNGVYADIPENEKDLLTLMLEAEQKGEFLATDEDLRHNIAVLFLAGHETTANTLSFCMYHLAKNKGMQHKLREEVISVLGDKPNHDTPTIEELKQMKYMNTIIKENLRLNGPVDLLFSRYTKNDINLAGTVISKDTIVSIDFNAIHRNPKYWINPDEFIPERFNDGGEQESHEGLTWLPFSNGSRQCLGMNFSLAEQRLLLAMIVKNYEIDIPKDSIHFNHIVYENATNMAPSSLELTFTKRY